MYKLSKADHEYITERRGNYQLEPGWYAAMTHWGRERALRDKFRKDYDGCGMEELLLPELADEPGAGEQSKNQLLFGGHLFFRCRMNDELYMGICAHPWVFKIFGRAYRMPDIIPDEEMDVFRRVLMTVPRPQLVTRSQIGDQATVIDGIMKGLSGRVVGVSAKYVKIEAQFSFLSHTNSIVVSVSHAQVVIGAEADNCTCGQANKLMGKN